MIFFLKINVNGKQEGTNNSKPKTESYIPGMGEHKSIGRAPTVWMTVYAAERMPGRAVGANLVFAHARCSNRQQRKNLLSLKRSISHPPA